jgi:large subunit ribosomal protein L30
VSDKGQRIVRIKWIRSGIGFSYHQKRIVRSLGLKKLNQEVERPDTPQIRGLVAKVPHLVKIVEASSKAAWTAVPEYTISAPEAAPSKLAETAPEAAAEETEKAEAPVSPPLAPLPSQGGESGVGAKGEVMGAPEPPLVESPTAAEAATKTAGDLAATEPRTPAGTRAKKSAPARKKAGAKKGRPKARKK